MGNLVFFITDLNIYTYLESVVSLLLNFNYFLFFKDAVAILPILLDCGGFKPGNALPIIIYSGTGKKIWELIIKHGPTIGATAAAGITTLDAALNIGDRFRGPSGGSEVKPDSVGSSSNTGSENQNPGPSGGSEVKPDSVGSSSNTGSEGNQNQNPGSGVSNTENK